MKNSLSKDISLLQARATKVKGVEQDILTLLKNTLALMKEALRTNEFPDELLENMDELSEYLLDDTGLEMDFANKMEDLIRDFEEFCEPGGTELSVVVDEICNTFAEEDTLDTYQKVQACCCDCIKLLDKNLFTKEEQNQLLLATFFWQRENYQQGKIESIRNLNRKKGPVTEPLQKLLASILMPYEDKAHGFDRPFVLESFVYNMEDLDVNPNELLYIILKHFPEYNEL